MLEVRDESGDVVASVHANLMGTQQVQIPSRTQGNLTVSLGDQEQRLPHPVRYRQRQAALSRRRPGAMAADRTGLTDTVPAMIATVA